MAEGLLVVDDLVLGAAAASGVGLVACAARGDDPATDRVSGSGIGPSIAQRLLSYFERINCSILLFRAQM